MFRFILTLLSMSALVFTAVAQNTATMTENMTDDCVTSYDAKVDYFPVKTTIDYAEKFDVTYFSNYKVVTVLDAYDSADPAVYVLVQCGTPSPDRADFDDDVQFIEVPSGDLITMSTTQLPHVVELGLLDHLIGVDSIFYVNTPEVRDRFDDGDLIEIGSGTGINVEMVLDAQPDIVMTYGFDPDTDAYPVLVEAGLFTVFNADWRESTPLARAEWIKFTALFFNAEETAEEAFDDIDASYTEARDLAAGVADDERITVLWNSFSSYSDTWDIPGAETYSGALLLDAGARIAMGDEAPTRSARLSFESVYDGALDADVWIANLFGITSLADVDDIDPRYEDFAAVQSGNIWNNDLDVNENGGFNYYELGVTHPDLILRDLIAIFYPELLPDHQFRFFRRLEASS